MQYLERKNFTDLKSVVESNPFLDDIVFFVNDRTKLDECKIQSKGIGLMVFTHEKSTVNQLFVTPIPIEFYQDKIHQAIDNHIKKLEETKKIYETIGYEYIDKNKNKKTVLGGIEETKKLLSNLEQKKLSMTDKDQLFSLNNLIISVKQSINSLQDKIKNLEKSINELNKFDVNKPINHLLKSMENKAINENLALLCLTDKEVKQKSVSIKIKAKSNEKHTKSLSLKKLRDKIKFTVRMMTDVSLNGLKTDYGYIRLLNYDDSMYEKLEFLCMDNLNKVSGLPDLLSHNFLDANEYLKINKLTLNSIGLDITIIPIGT
ncbi:hypothetical protein ACN4EE_14060 [Geminocystis sp. CENA526]|uniref:hypothetical protein n=1 Tax=Geminocystis sp. CENA526 TaxID=1355871 RepID=UPI003D6E747F